MYYKLLLIIDCLWYTIPYRVESYPRSKMSRSDRMQLVKDKISIIELQKMSENMFEGIVKAVVDVEKGHYDRRCPNACRSRKCIA